MINAEDERNQLLKERDTALFQLWSIARLETMMHDAHNDGDTELGDRLGDQLSLAILRAGKYVEKFPEVFE